MTVYDSVSKLLRSHLENCTKTQAVMKAHCAHMVLKINILGLAAQTHAHTHTHTNTHAYADTQMLQ